MNSRKIIPIILIIILLGVISFITYNILVDQSKPVNNGTDFGSFVERYEAMDSTRKMNFLQEVVNKEVVWEGYILKIENADHKGKPTYSITLLEKKNKTDGNLFKVFMISQNEVNGLSINQKVKLKGKIYKYNSIFILEDCRVVK